MSTTCPSNEFYPYFPRIRGPVALYANVAIEPQFYKPRRYIITAISLGTTTIVTTSVIHDYVIGQQVRLLIPVGYGCIQLNEQFGYVISIPSTTQVEIAINSYLNVDPFITASLAQVPQILAIGDVNTGAINATGRSNTGTFIPGSFLDISPC